MQAKEDRVAETHHVVEHLLQLVVLSKRPNVSKSTPPQNVYNHKQQLRMDS